MGYDAYVKTVYGVKIPRSSLTITKEERACKHEVNEGHNFCSMCGKPKFQKVEIDLIEEPMENNRLSYFYSNYDNSDEVILGFSLLKKTDSEEYFELKDITSDMKDEIMQFLSEHNHIPLVKNPTIYSFIYHSY